MMKVLHVSVYHLCLAQAGTEGYIDSLSNELKEIGAENRFLIINSQTPIKKCEKNVILLNPDKIQDIPSRIRHEMVLFNPDVICIHTSDGYEMTAAEYAVENKIPYFFFFHTISWICYQRSFMFCGKVPCSFVFHPFRCAICVCSHKKQNLFLGTVKAFLGHIAYLFHLAKLSWYQTAKKELCEKEFLLRNAFKVVVFNEKDKQLFLKNGFTEKQLELVPQGLHHDRLIACRENALKARKGCLQLGYIGRCWIIKGCDILVDAVLQMPKDADFQLHIYGYKQESEYCHALKERAKKDARIFFHDVMPPEQVIYEYAKLDVLCIPSIVFETGPLTLLEGVYSGCFVAGSDQIGQMDFLTEYGQVIRPNTSEKWKLFFMDCISNLQTIRRRNIQFDSYRTQATIARKVLEAVNRKETDE